jgi:diguanylate cyclase (GGDEF)-like protein
MSKKNSITSLSLKRRIWIAVALVTLMPLVVLLNYLYGSYKYISLFVESIVVFLIFLGWYIIFDIFSSIRKVNVQTKKTLEYMGEKTPFIANEVESLESLMEMLSLRVKTGFTQLTELSQKTDEINRDVSKKLFALSAILQANDLVSKDAPAEDVIQFLIQRLHQILGVRLCYCALKENAANQLNTVACVGIDTALLENIVKKESSGIFALKNKVVLDKNHASSLHASWFSPLGMKNIAISPLFSKEQLLGIIIVGSNEDNFSFSEDDLNIVTLFSQNIAIIWEHKKLLVKVEELEIVDYLTGLYNEKYIFKRLEEEIARAITYQRPCGFLLMEIKNYDGFQKDFGIIEAEKLLKKIAKAFKESLRPIDIAGRFGINKLVAILIEKNKRQSHEVAKNLKEKLDSQFGDKVKMYYSVAENPIDGTTAPAIISFAQSCIDMLGANEII